MKSSKFQAPTSREVPNTKHQTGPVLRYWSLKFGASLVVGCWLLVLLMCPSAGAQNYSIDWFTIDGGGGISTGAVYSVSGTIGQPDAGPAMSGGNFSLTGGFWSLISVAQTPGAPSLTITRSGTSVIVSWPSPSGFVLRQNNNVNNAAGWSAFGGTINNNGTIKSVSINPPTGNLYFRLKQ